MPSAEPAADTDDRTDSDWGRTLRRAVGVILGVLILILVFQNTEVVAVHVLFWRARMSLALLVLLVAAVSAVATLIVAKWLSARRRRDRR